MATELTYNILSAVGEATPKGNAAFEQLEQFVNEHIREGWQPLGGVVVSSVSAPRLPAGQETTGSCA